MHQQTLRTECHYYWWNLRKDRSDGPITKLFLSNEHSLTICTGEGNRISRFKFSKDPPRGGVNKWNHRRHFSAYLRRILRTKWLIIVRCAVKAEDEWCFCLVITQRKSYDDKLLQTNVNFNFCWKCEKETLQWFDKTQLMCTSVGRGKIVKFRSSGKMDHMIPTFLPGKAKPRPLETLMKLKTRLLHT